MPTPPQGSPDREREWRIRFLTNLAGRIAENTHDFGELGKYVPVSYLNRVIDELRTRLIDGLVEL